MIFLIAATLVASFLNIFSVALNHKVTITALFYVDLRGRIILVTGTVPESVEQTIKSDFQERTKNHVSITVVPLFENESDIPKKKKILQLLKTTYSSVYVTSIPIVKSKVIVAELKNHLETQFQRNLTSKKTSRKHRRRGTGTAIATAQALPMKDFVIHNVYYGICPNGANGCQLKSASEFSSTNPRTPLYIGATPLVQEYRKFVIFPYTRT